MRDPELRLLFQELRRRWSGAETRSFTARRGASKEVEFTCGQIRASEARPFAAARPSRPVPTAAPLTAASLRAPPQPALRPCSESLEPSGSLEDWLAVLLVQGKQ